MAFSPNYPNAQKPKRINPEKILEEKASFDVKCGPEDFVLLYVGSST